MAVRGRPGRIGTVKFTPHSLLSHAFELRVFRNQDRFISRFTAFSALLSLSFLVFFPFSEPRQFPLEISYQQITSVIFFSSICLRWSKYARIYYSISLLRTLASLFFIIYLSFFSFFLSFLSFFLSFIQSSFLSDSAFFIFLPKLWLFFYICSFFLTFIFFCFSHTFPHISCILKFISFFFVFLSLILIILMSLSSSLSFFLFFSIILF
ncbi:unnamed protein product [Acanthosepion pharaonis]|uniref:Uncharacterized protein n=1 Tax=Acanthosepion pharaonis TaxID=158019 RepID=A0A812EM05_ACAPH|nr:unnamed protein product [Sepia pharaonis]